MQGAFQRVIIKATTMKKSFEKKEKHIMKKLFKVLALTLAAVLVFAATGCGKGFDSSKNVSVVTREDGSGTKSAFMEIIGLKGKKDVSGVIVSSSTAAVLAEVKSNPHAIAYDSLGYVTDEVKKLKVDGVEATAENIKSGSYNISRPLSVVYKEINLSDADKAFFEFLQSANANELITGNGYVTYVDNAKAYEKHGVSGKVTLTGSTSLQPLMQKLATAFEEIEKNVTVTVGGGGSGTGYNDAKNDVSSFGMISEKFKQEKAEGCVSTVVALDGIAIIVNKANPLDDISLADLKNIYDADAGDNAITTWAKLIG